MSAGRLGCGMAGYSVAKLEPLTAQQNSPAAPFRDFQPIVLLTRSDCRPRLQIDSSHRSVRDRRLIRYVMSAIKISRTR